VFGVLFSKAVWNDRNNNNYLIARSPGVPTAATMTTVSARRPPALWFVLVSALACLQFTRGQDISPVFVAFHALEVKGSEPVWSARAKISVDSLTQATASLEENPLTEEEQRKLSSVLGMYQLKVVDTATGHHVIAWTPSPDPLSLGLKLSLDSSGFLEGVSFIPPREGVSAAVGRQVALDVMQAAPAPETATYIQRLEIERREKEKSQGQDNRSFLAKYWMYIVPVVIFLLISGGSNPDGQQQ